MCKIKYCPLCGDPFGADGNCDCGSDRYLSEATKSYLDAAICALHDNVVEKEISHDNP